MIEIEIALPITGLYKKEELYKQALRIFTYPVAHLYNIWQHSGADGDFVRYTEACRWEWNGRPVPGYARANGNRILIIHADGSFEVIRTR